jgi:cellulose synthase/poly-beta-1,6-N-acetylglucosamine synthase-like glycosyltransferase
MALSIWMILTVVFSLFYYGLMLSYWWNWARYPKTKIEKSNIKTKVTVIVPARNEAHNILNILSDLKAQTYDSILFETIVVDDSSTDETVELVERYKFENTRLIHLNTFFDENGLPLTLKKKAIETAVNLAEGELIMVTDADCRLPKDWIELFVMVYQKEQSALIAGPVIFNPAETVFEKFQALDFIGMMAITVAYFRKNVFNMCNGSNLAYQKSAFLAVGGYKGIDHVASGDDMLLIYKVAAQYPGKISYLKNEAAIVKTAPERKMSDFLQQRFRWTSKSGAYQNKTITRDLGLVYLFNWIILINVFLFAFGFRSILVVFIPQLAFKVMVDFLLLFSATRFFKKRELMEVFIPSQFLHLIYIIIVGTLGNLIPYKWKGRRIKK